MNELDNQLHKRKIITTIIDIIVYASIAYMMYTYVWPMLSTYIH
jgi:ABC-type bacteriocin/lantibiotic exporter with double-glycine peptidase domain